MSVLEVVLLVAVAVLAVALAAVVTRGRRGRREPVDLSAYTWVHVEPSNGRSWQ